MPRPKLYPVGSFLLTILLAAGSGLILLGQEKPKIKKVPVKHSSSASGADMYKQYCASCHGLTGKGDGPAAAALKNPPSDITLMARHNQGQFPAMKVQNILEGKGSPAAHGTSDMPIWGPILRHLGGGDQTGTLRVFNLTKHLESMQAN